MQYTQSQLEEAFKKVQNKEHWKNPIDTYVSIPELPITEAAIRHFTATEMMIGATHEGKVHIWADGYRLGPAGDH